MNVALEIVEVKESFREKVAVEANKPAGKKKLKKSLKVSYATIGRIINTGFVRRNTLELFLAKIEGPEAKVEDYIIG